MVVAVPPALVVQRDEEQVAALQRLQHRPAARLAAHRVAQRPAQPAQHGRAEQEVLDVGRLALDDLLDQVVDDVAVVPGEAGDELGGVVASLHRQRGELEGGDPALGATLERGDVAAPVSSQAHRLVEVGRGLLGGEAQVGGADLDQLAARPQPRQRQGRVGPAGDHQVQLRREVVEQEGHRVVDLARLDDVVVVEDQHDVPVDGAEVVEEGGEHRLHGQRLRCLEELEGAGAHRRSEGPEPGDDVGPEVRRVVVAGVQRQPRRGARRPPAAVGQPLREQRGLAEARRGGDEHELGAGPAVQTLPQPRPRAPVPAAGAGRRASSAAP